MGPRSRTAVARIAPSSARPEEKSDEGPRVFDGRSESSTNGRSGRALPRRGALCLPAVARKQRRKTLLLMVALVFGWCLWALTNVTAWLLSTHDQIPGVLRWTAVELPAGFLVCCLLLVAYPPLQRRVGGLWPSVLAAAPLCLAGGILWYLLTGHVASLLDLAFRGWHWFFLPDWKDLLNHGASRMLVMGSFCLLYYAVDHWFELGEQRDEVQRARALAQQAQLQMLRYQLHPHFLFNALNSLRAMIVEDRERARQMVTELASLLRYSLAGQEQLGTIRQELQVVESYLAIQRIRFEERLRAEVHVVPAALEAKVPSFLMHPLVENAVKHGMQTSPCPLRVEIEVTLQEGELRILVANTGRLAGKDGSGGRVEAEGTGTGLENVRQRLALAFAGCHDFRLFERDGWVRAEIRLSLAAAVGSAPADGAAPALGRVS